MKRTRRLSCLLCHFVSLFFIFIIARFTFDDFKCNDDCQVVNFEIGGPNDFAPCYSNGFFDLIYKEEPAIW
jgi:hypothetical protein